MGRYCHVTGAILHIWAFDLSWAINPETAISDRISRVSRLWHSAPAPSARTASMAAGRQEALKPFEERASDAEARLAKLEALLLSKDGLGSGSETSSAAAKDVLSKLDAVSAECLAEKEKNRKLTMENEKLQYRISHLIRAVKEADSKQKSL
ncbi:uncharacterized protein LOC124673457 [Lolium rigidum]|uniref:uncharacterized protein LOC124673457 n=1 Tax=Lolium rigidum TaxID=89674 RepID=UPI001F5CCCE2|nr:uncharacterized protein LOC124673457 [Lolium rigidum]